MIVEGSHAGRMGYFLAAVASEVPGGRDYLPAATGSAFPFRVACKCAWDFSIALCRDVPRIAALFP